MYEYLARRKTTITGDIILEVIHDDTQVDVTAKDTAEGFVLIMTEESLYP